MSRRYFGSLRRRDSGRWQIRYTNSSGKRVSYPVTYVRRSEAQRVLGELERQSLGGGPGLDHPGRAIPFGVYATRWLEQHPGLRPRTVEVYASLSRRHLFPLLGEVPLGRLDTAMVREWRGRLLASGVSKTMVAKSYRLLRAILNTAVQEDELIAVNPCRIKGAGEEHAAERPVLSLDQVLQLADLVPDRWRFFVLLKTFAALRWGEITALTRADIDVSLRTVRIHRQFLTIPGGFDIGPPKSKAGLRTVSFPAGLVPDLMDHLRLYAAPGPSGLVFPGEHGQPLRRGNFNPALNWKAICTELGVPDLHLHDLRHTGNTLAAQSGASLRDLMARMGHDSPAAALIYQHSSRAADQGIAAAMDALLPPGLGRLRTELPEHLGPVEGPKLGVDKPVSAERASDLR